MIAGERVVLAPLTLDDAPRLFEYRSDPSVSRYQCFEPASVDDARAFIRDVLSGSSGWRQFGIRVTGSARLAGDAGFRLDGGSRQQAEIGITLAPEYRGRGLATEAVGVLLDHMFGELDVHRVFASVDPRNTASDALFRRLGMRQEAHHHRSVWFKGEWADDVIFAVLRPEWERRATGGPADVSTIGG